MKWSYDNTCRLQRKAAFQVHCMKRRRINATERDHYTKELNILIIWLHPALEISIVNWLIFLRSGNPQCTGSLKELTGQNTFKSPENIWKWPKKMIKYEKPNNLLSFNHLMILHWERAKQLSRLCLHCYGNSVYHAHLMCFILKYIHDIQKYSCFPPFEGTMPLTTLGQDSSSSMPSSIYYCSM